MTTATPVAYYANQLADLLASQQASDAEYEHAALKACRRVYAQHIRLAGEAARAGDIKARDSHRMAAIAAESCIEEVEFALRGGA